MDQQQLFNVLFALVGVLGGWWMNASDTALLQAANNQKIT